MSVVAHAQQVQHQKQLDAASQQVAPAPAAIAPQPAATAEPAGGTPADAVTAAPAVTFAFVEQSVALLQPVWVHSVPPAEGRAIAAAGVTMLKPAGGQCPCCYQIEICICPPPRTALRLKERHMARPGASDRKPVEYLTHRQAYACPIGQCYPLGCLRGTPKSSKSNAVRGPQLPRADGTRWPHLDWLFLAN